MQSFFVVGVAQLVEHQVVALVAAGSIPVTHPTQDLKSSRSAAFFIGDTSCVVGQSLADDMSGRAVAVMTPMLFEPLCPGFGLYRAFLSIARHPCAGLLLLSGSPCNRWQ